MRGLDPRIHDFTGSQQTWMAGTSPAMTVQPNGLILRSGRSPRLEGWGPFASFETRPAGAPQDEGGVGRAWPDANQLLNFTPVIASRLPCQIFSLSAFGMSMPSMMRSVSRVYIVPFSGSNGQSEAKTILSRS